MRRLMELVIVLALVMLAVPPSVPSVVSAQDEKDKERQPMVNVELILDVSGSMAQVIETGETRMDAAKRVLREVVGAIPDREGINVGLRIYGHEGDNTEAGQAESCQSSDLVAPIKGVDKRKVLGEVEDLQPTGWTPLALSLERAGDDFKAAEGVTNAAVLITDGLETCGGDPCAVAGELHDADINLVTHVVGFALVPEEQATLGCIAEEGGGQLVGAANATELTAALFEVLEQLEVVQGVGFIGGNALGVLPEGDAGELSVIAVGPYDGNVLPIVVRNNTSEDIIRVTAVASAKNASGQLIATGNDQGFNPNLVRSGGVTFGYAYFQGVELPADTEFDVDLDSKSATDDRFENIRDLEVVEASTVEGRVVGTLQNTYDADLTGPISIAAACFDEEGSLLSHERGYSTEEELAPQETVAFQVSDLGNEPCPLFLVAGQGYDNSFSPRNDVEPPTNDDDSKTGTDDSKDDDKTAATEESSQPTSRADESDCADPSSPEDVLNALKSAGLPIGDYEEYTAETDPNELLGRPGQYTGKLNFRDARLAPETTTFDITDGGSIEVFASVARAEARHTYVVTITESALMFAEYDYLEGTVLLRLSSRLTPDQAEEYADALKKVIGCGETG